MSETPLNQILAAATLLTRAAQWDAARELLNATQVAPAEEPHRLLALAEIAVDQDFAQQTRHSPDALAALTQALATGSDQTLQWDLDLLRLRNSYFIKLLAAATTDDGLAVQAAALESTAPDDRRRATVAFYQGLIADNLLANSDDAFKHYTDSLTLCESTGDTLQASYALRHLGDHAHTAGDLPLARTHWQTSTELRQQAGHIPGVLAQQALLAVLAEAENNPTAAQAIATETNRWANQLNLTYLVTQTAALLHDE